MRIAGFLKVRNEIIRSGNIYTALETLDRVCDMGVLCDDASTDGTSWVLHDFVMSRPPGAWVLLQLEPHEQSFDRELIVKQEMLQLLHNQAVKPDWIFWLDGDEVLDAAGSKGLRSWLEHVDPINKQAYRFHYTQAWRNTAWARTDSGFDDGWYIKLWRYSQDLSFDTRHGTHHAQFPKQIPQDLKDIAPFEIIHLGNVGVNLRFKAIQYSGGRGGVDRHLAFGHTLAESLATGQGWDQAHYSEPNPQYREIDASTYPDFAPRAPGPKPEPFSLDHIRRIRSFKDMRGMAETFTVILPTFNRARTIPKALDSLLAQKYDKWVCVVLDDGSSDDTAAVMQRYQDLDPRIFYARYRYNCGGVAMNEIGMSLACEMSEWWTRLGSDDFFGPDKLALDAEALKKHGACWGCYVVQRHDQNGTRLEEMCCPCVPSAKAKSQLLSGGFIASWANCAVRTSVLREVHKRFGHFVDGRLRNMEDFLANAYIATVTDWRWRGIVNGVYCDDESLGLKSEVLEAVWTDDPRPRQHDGQTGASGNQQQSARDDMLTRQIIASIPLKLKELGIEI